MKEAFKQFLISKNLYSDDLMNKFDIYYKFLISYNQNVNLTAITEEDEVYKKHFLDSLLPVDLIAENSTVCDIGAGAGFPSVPLALVKNIEVLACDSLNKRITFLNILKEKLNIQNFNTIHTRAEDLNMREKFDYVVARAVAPLNILLEYCLPYVKIGGKMLAYKGSNAEEEIANSANALNILGGKISNIHTYDLSQNEKRVVIEIEKTMPTPKKYPRNGNKARLSPLN